jgi:hypothetical protein
MPIARVPLVTVRADKPTAAGLTTPETLPSSSSVISLGSEPNGGRTMSWHAVSRLLFVDLLETSAVGLFYRYVAESSYPNRRGYGDKNYYRYSPGDAAKHFLVSDFVRFGTERREHDH